MIQYAILSYYFKAYPAYRQTGGKRMHSAMIIFDCHPAVFLI